MENQNTTAVAEKQQSFVQSFDLASGNLPDLSKGKEVPVDLTSEYWTPEKEGEFKLGFYQSIQQSTYEDKASGEVTELPCVIFVEQRADLSVVTVRNGSKRLVAAFEDAESTGKIEPGTPVKITFLGKSRNKTNSFMSDRWSIRPIAV